ncbi:hypothetical protein IF1G_08330 [Cordyceps javanica]|uniref:Uncharacterized protein n=1 Tax=Cordyceps javanica TaxID=43265 RepID=A0A545UU78_9HYPO|nr:hypothetical protein IF1G_08330 [Cordyceps javanica]
MTIGGVEESKRKRKTGQKARLCHRNLQLGALYGEENIKDACWSGADHGAVRVISDASALPARVVQAVHIAQHKSMRSGTCLLRHIVENLPWTVKPIFTGSCVVVSMDFVARTSRENRQALWSAAAIYYEMATRLRISSQLQPSRYVHPPGRSLADCGGCANHGPLHTGIRRYVRWAPRPRKAGPRRLVEKLQTSATTPADEVGLIQRLPQGEERQNRHRFVTARLSAKCNPSPPSIADCQITKGVGRWQAHLTCPCIRGGKPRLRWPGLVWPSILTWLVLTAPSGRLRGIMEGKQKQTAFSLVPSASQVKNPTWTHQRSSATRTRLDDIVEVSRRENEHMLHRSGLVKRRMDQSWWDQD